MLTPTSSSFSCRPGIAMLASSLVVILACDPVNDRPDTNDAGLEPEQPGLAPTEHWGEFEAKRPERSPDEVMRRAGRVAEVVLRASSVPKLSVLDPQQVANWAHAMADDPYRERALHFEVEGQQLTVRYRPASDRLTVSTPARHEPVEDPLEPNAPSGLDHAAAIAQTCLHALEQKGVLGSGEFSREPNYTSSRATYGQASATTRQEHFSFVYNPRLDGLPLTSAEVIVSVNPSAELCRRITVSGQIRLQRIGDAVVELTSEAKAKQLVMDKVAAEAPVEVTVIVDGHFGYYLPLTTTRAKLGPMFIASYATQTGPADQPLVSRRSLVGLPLAKPEKADLVELLGPDW